MHWIGFRRLVLCARPEFDDLQPEAVFAARNHDESERPSTITSVELRLKPRAQPAIANLRMTVPEAGVQSTLNLQMVQLHFNRANLLWKVPSDVARANRDAGIFVAFALGFDEHIDLPY